MVDPDIPDANDPNGQKFLPDLIHFDRTKHQSTEAFNTLVNYQIFLKDEEKFNLIFDDSSYDSRQGDIVDFAFANGLYFLNLKGMGKPERSCKVDRLQEILEELRRIQAVMAEQEAQKSQASRTGSAMMNTRRDSQHTAQ